MDRKELIAGLLNRMGTLTVNTFNERLAAQKIIFIAQNKMANFPTRFPYKLYVSGPYSGQLANELYSIVDTSKYGKVKFKNPEREQKYSDYAEVMKPYLTNRAVLELTGTLVYLERHGFGGEELKNKLKEIKPRFTDKEYNNSYQLLERINNIFT